MHHRPPERPEGRIVPRRLGTTLEVDDEIVRIGRARGVAVPDPRRWWALALVCDANSAPVLTTHAACGGDS